jgi:hypothetical protein
MIARADDAHTPPQDIYDEQQIVDEDDLHDVAPNDSLADEADDEGAAR